eukprot:scaffold135584_cov33-Tisochrysis_lutea.AAC.2
MASAAKHDHPGGSRVQRAKITERVDRFGRPALGVRFERLVPHKEVMPFVVAEHDACLAIVRRGLEHPSSTEGSHPLILSPRAPRPPGGRLRRARRTRPQQAAAVYALSASVLAQGVGAAEVDVAHAAVVSLAHLSRAARLRRWRSGRWRLLTHPLTHDAPYLHEVSEVAGLERE